MESDIDRIWKYSYDKVRSGKTNETAAIHVRQKQKTKNPTLWAVIKEESKMGSSGFFFLAKEKMRGQ